MLRAAVSNAGAIRHCLRRRLRLRRRVLGSSDVHGVWSAPAHSCSLRVSIKWRRRAGRSTRAVGEGTRAGQATTTTSSSINTSTTPVRNTNVMISASRLRIRERANTDASDAKADTSVPSVASPTPPPTTTTKCGSSRTTITSSWRRTNGAVAGARLLSTYLSLTSALCANENASFRRSG